MRPSSELRAGSSRANGTVAPEQFTASMRKLATGVAVVTTLVNDRPWGVTLSSVSSFSADPARLTLSIGKNTATSAFIAEHEQFGVAILPHDRAGLAKVLAARGVPKFIPEQDLCSPGRVLGLPFIDGAIYNLECTAGYLFEVVDHLLVIADVVSVQADSDADTAAPLTFYDRTFGSFAAVKDSVQDRSTS